VPTTFDDPPTDTDAGSVAVIERTVDHVRATVLPLLEAARR
jgi:hypothetical protein